MLELHARRKVVSSSKILSGVEQLVIMELLFNCLRQWNKAKDKRVHCEVHITIRLGGSVIQISKGCGLSQLPYFS